MSALTDLAALAVTKFGLTGVDWAALTAQGRGSVWDTDYVQQYMVPASQQLALVVGTLDLGDRTAIEAMQQSYDINVGILSGLADGVLRIAGGTQIIKDMAVQVDLDREAMRYTISHAYASAMYGLRLHVDETIHHSSFSDAEIAAHANTVVGTMNAIVLMDRVGAFKALGLKNKAFSGPPLGAVPVAAIIAATVVAVAFLALVAWVIVSMHDLNAKNAIVASTCQQAQAAGDAATTQQCINTLTDPNRAAGTALSKQVKDFFTGLIPYALGGVAIYALYLAAPSLIKLAFSGKKAAA